MRRMLILSLVLVACSNGAETATPTTSMALPEATQATTTSTTPEQPVATTTTTTTAIAAPPAFEPGEGLTATPVPGTPLTIAVPDSFTLVDLTQDDLAAGLEGVDVTPEAQQALDALESTGIEASLYAYDFGRGTLAFVPNVNVVVQQGTAGIGPEFFAQASVGAYENLGGTILESNVADLEVPAVYVEVLIPITDDTVSHAYQLTLFGDDAMYFITYSANEPVDAAYEALILEALYRFDLPGADTGCADVIDVVVSSDADGVYTFAVTVASPDTGWDKYADAWIVREGDVELARRVLTHPHVDEQPFTRSLSGIETSAGEVTVSAHDSVVGECGLTQTVALP